MRRDTSKIRSPFRIFRRTVIIINDKTVIVSDEDLDISFLSDLFRSMFDNIESIRAGVSSGGTTKQLIIKLM